MKVAHLATLALMLPAIDASRRLRNLLTTRRYYSTEDVDARTTELTAEYRRVCGRRKNRQ